MITKILLATDASDGALKAATAAAEIAKKFDAKLTVLHVSELAQALKSGINLTRFDMEQEFIADIQNAIIRSTGRVLDAQEVSYQVRKTEGHPAQEIVHVADEEHSDLIVMGSQGENNISTFLLGSICDRVTHHAHCPVLIIK
jgi:nucleotide-binding universal stress UspA family protein